MTKTKEEIVAEFEEIFNSLKPTEKAFVRAAFTGEGLDEAVDALLAEHEIEVTV